MLSSPETGLLLQALLVLAVVAATARMGLRDARAALRAPGPWVVAGIGLALTTWLLPRSEYHFAGHEGAYGELLDGVLPRADLGSHRIFPVPSGLAWALGQLLDSELARTVWLWGNRLALPVAVLAAAWCASRVVGADRRAPTHAAIGLVLCVPLLAWSATAFAIAPALALGLIALGFGLSGRPAACVAWGGLALGTRMESAVFLLAGALAAWPTLREAVLRRPLALAGGLAVFAIQAWTLAGKRAELPLESTTPDLSILLENARCLLLGGSWFAPLTLAVLALTARRGSLRPGWPLLVGLAIALVQPLGLVDVGARHLLPAAALLGVWAVSRGGGGWRVPALLAVVALQSTGELRDLVHRYAAGPDAHLPRWTAAADAGGTAPLPDRLDPDCYLVLPGGEEAHPGAAPTGDVREIHNAALEVRRRACVQWAVHTDAEFLGDTAAERFDRARLVLDLEPVGWILRPDDARWLLWERRPRDPRGSGREAGDPGTLGPTGAEGRGSRGG